MMTAHCADPPLFSLSVLHSCDCVTLAMVMSFVPWCVTVSVLSLGMGMYVTD